jgi:hypothetical protein
MKRTDDFGTASPAAVDSHGGLRRALARRLADAHRGIGDAVLLGFVSGSVVDGLADGLSDIDMSVVFERLPAEAELVAACERAGAEPWTWRSGTLDEGGMVVALQIDGIEAQIGYCDLATLQAEIDAILVEHQPETPLHKLAEGVLKAEPLVGGAVLAVLQTRLAAFPPELGRAMVGHFLAAPMPWRAVSQLLERDAALWCRELQVEAAYRLLGVLAGLNGLYYTRFQLKRMHRFADRLRHAPAALAERMEAMLCAAPAEAFRMLYALEGEVLALVEAQMPEVDTAAAQARRRRFEPWFAAVS